MVGIKIDFYKKSKRQVIATNISLPGAWYDRKIFSYNKATNYSATEVVPSFAKVTPCTLYSKSDIIKRLIIPNCSTFHLSKRNVYISHI